MALHGRIRGRIDIACDVLRIARDGSRKTRIMYQANLSYVLLQKYMQMLVKQALIEEQNGRVYKTTPLGIRYLIDYGEFKESSSYARHKLESLESMLGQRGRMRRDADGT